MKTGLCIAISSLAMAPSIAAAQSPCPEVTYEAESMFHSTGGPIPGGWNIWDNGFISQTVSFDGGPKVVSVVVRGEPAVGVPPNMTVLVGGNFIYSYSIFDTEWATYRFILDGDPGDREVQIHFDNDFFGSGQDRNLLVDKMTVGCGGGWTNLELINGWVAAEGSNVPAVGLINGVVTFRGALDGSGASNNTPFCLSDGHTVESADFTQYRPSDVGQISVRAAMANGAQGSIDLGPAARNQSSKEDPNPPDFERPESYCVNVTQDGQGAELGDDAKELTSLEGVSFVQSSYAVPNNALQLLGPLDEWNTIYPMRGTDGAATGLADGLGVYVKVVNGFVRFLGSITSPIGTPAPIDPVLFTLPTGMGLVPGNPVYVPVTLSPLSQPVSGRIVIQPSGEVVVEGAGEKARAGVSLDGVAYSMSSPPSAVPLSLASGWSPVSSRAVRARNDSGIVRLEGAVEDGASAIIGTLAPGLRPAHTVNVTANALFLAQPATLSIDPAGSIEVVSPPMVVADQGISLDGVSFALGVGFQCMGECSSATELSRYESSGPFGTTGERWFVVDESINGWQASAMSGRTITVNGVVVSPGQPLPAPVNGAYYFHFSAGAHDWASWSFW